MERSETAFLDRTTALEALIIEKTYAQETSVQELRTAVDTGEQKITYRFTDLDARITVCSTRLAIAEQDLHQQHRPQQPQTADPMSKQRNS